MLPEDPEKTSRVETTMRTDDYELLCRVAKNRRTSVAAIIRTLLYQHVQPLAAAQAEREAQSLQRAKDERALREWGGTKKQSSDYDPAAPERYAPWLEE